MRAFHAVLVTSLVSALAAACGGGTPVPTNAVNTAASAAPSALPSTGAVPSAVPSVAASAAVEVVAPASWKDATTKEQQAAFMKKNVAPQMGKVFQAHDATRYANFGCKTCHGPEYKVPKDYLPHLTFQGGKITQFTDKPEIAKWMHEQVVPAMATIFGQQPYDPKTNTGFGCAGCHTVDMK